MPKYTTEDGQTIDTGEQTIEQMQAEAVRLRNHSATLLGEKKTESEKRQEAENSAKTVQDALTALQGSFDTSIAAKDTELAAANAKVTTFKQTVMSLAVAGPATKLANELTNAPELALPHIMSRLTAEVSEDGTAITKVLSKEGKLSEMTLDDLMKELAADKKLAPIIKKTQAAGSGIFDPSRGSGQEAKPLSTQEMVAKRKAARAAS